MRALTIAVLVTLLACAAAFAQELALPAEVGSTLRLAPDDHVLPMAESEELTFTAPEGLGNRQVLLAFRARIDNPTTVGSTNALIIQVNGQPVQLSTARRQLRLLDKPNTFAWTNPPELTWYITTGQWRIAYAPDFEILLDREHYGPQAYSFAFDISDLVQPGENTITLQNTGNEAVAEHAGAPLDLVFRHLRLEVREGPGVRGGEPDRADDTGPWQPRERRSAPITIDDERPAAMVLTIRGHRYELTSEFSAPGTPGETQWLTFPRATGPVTTPVIVGPGWRLERTITERLDDGRMLVRDSFTSTGDEPVGIRIRHRLRLLDGSAERVNFGGLEDPARVVDGNLANSPYLFLPRDDSGVALVAEDDLLRQHAKFEFDDDNQIAGLTDDWFGLRPAASYTIAWAIYATDTGSVFDIINMLRADWLPEPFTIEGGINFFEPILTLQCLRAAGWTVSCSLRAPPTSATAPSSLPSSTPTTARACARPSRSSAACARASSASSTTTRSSWPARTCSSATPTASCATPAARRVYTRPRPPGAWTWRWCCRRSTTRWAARSSRRSRP